VGEVSPVLAEEVNCSGWIDMIDIPWKPDCRSEISWALENGIAPWQPFLIRFGEPEYTGGGYYEPREVDVTYDTELVRVMPWKPESVVKRWERAIRDRDAFIIWKNKRDAEFAKNQRTMTDHMFLRTDVYFARGQRAWDEMEMPAGTRCLLYSDWSDRPGCKGLGVLMIGESESGDHAEAMDNLVKAAAKELPHLTEEFIRGLQRGWWNR
jgi:hypothetical protein